MRDEIWRLPILNALGRHAEVLDTVEALRPRMAALPDPPGQGSRMRPIYSYFQTPIRSDPLDIGRSNRGCTGCGFFSAVLRIRSQTFMREPWVTKEPGCVGSARINGKGRRQRIVTVNWKACKAIKAYLAIRPKAAEDDHVFLTKFKRGIGPRLIELLVTKHLAEAGIRDALVHTLRHTFATHSAIKGTSLRVIQETLGHADLKTTSIYVGLARAEMDRQLQENAL